MPKTLTDIPAQLVKLYQEHLRANRPDKPDWPDHVWKWAHFARDSQIDLFDITPDRVRACFEDTREPASCLSLFLDWIQDQTYEDTAWVERQSDLVMLAGNPAYVALFGRGEDEYEPVPDDVEVPPWLSGEPMPIPSVRKPDQLEYPPETPAEKSPLELEYTSEKLPSYYYERGSYRYTPQEMDLRADDIWGVLRDTLAHYEGTYREEFVANAVYLSAHYLNWVIKYDDPYNWCPDLIGQFLYPKYDPAERRQMKFALRVYLAHLKNPEPFLHWLTEYESGIDEHRAIFGPPRPAQIRELRDAALVSLKDHLSSRKLAQLRFSDLTDDLKTPELRAYLSRYAGKPDDFVFPVKARQIRATIKKHI